MNQYPQAEPPPPMPVQQVPTQQYVGNRDGAAKGSALAVTVLVHVLIFLLLTFIVIQSYKEEPPNLVVESTAIEEVVTVDPKKFANSSKPDPAAPSLVRSTVIASTAMSPITVPSVEEVDDMEFGMSEGFGVGLGLGTGGAGGGGVGFFGSQSVANRVVFIVDVSQSLSEKQFTMIKDELKKSLTRLAPTIQYQVLFFAGPTWFAEDDFAKREKKRFIIEQGRQQYIWDTQGGAHMYELKNRKDLPSAKWKAASKANIHKTKKRVDEVKKIYGTDWEWPLKVALQNMEPKPDVIYFLTDGVTGDGEKTLDEIAKINGAKGKKKAKINTIAMMEPRAAGLLRKLARDAKGNFTVVHEDGTTTVDELKGSGRKDDGDKGKKKKPAAKKPAPKKKPKK